MRALVWFRADLRCGDNPALYHAMRAADRGVVGVFVVCPRQWREHDWADTRVEFLLRNLACLREQLARLHVPLLVRETADFEGVTGVLAQTAQALHCDALYFNREYEVNERRRDEAVVSAWRAAGQVVHAFDDQLILPPGAVRTRDGGCYTVFTPFRRAWLERVGEADDVEPLPSPRGVEALVCAPDPIPEVVDGFDLTRGHAELWPAGEKRAARRLGSFVGAALARYKKLRDYPAVEGTSCLSPYLAHGVLSPRQCLSEARLANGGRIDGGGAGAETWMAQLIWREFYRHVLVGFPRVCMGRAFKASAEGMRWRNDEDEYRAWCEGRTGFPIVDAAMRQLAATGWMHNRLRMIVAMLLTKDLLVDWRWGERYFMRHLVDGDLANNNGGWQWAASTGTDAVPYFRIFNPWQQARRFDPEAEFIKAWLPELRELTPRAVHDPTSAGVTARGGVGYPAPICDHAEARRRALAAFGR